EHRRAPPRSGGKHPARPWPTAPPTNRPFARAFARADHRRARAASPLRLAEALRIALLPAPRVGAHALEPERRAPAEQRRGRRRIGVARCNITGTAIDDPVRHLAAARLLERTHQLEHRIAGA